MRQPIYPAETACPQCGGAGTFFYQGSTIGELSCSRCGGSGKITGYGYATITVNNDTQIPMTIPVTDLIDDLRTEIAGLRKRIKALENK